MNNKENELEKILDEFRLKEESVDESVDAANEAEDTQATYENAENSEEVAEDFEQLDEPVSDENFEVEDKPEEEEEFELKFVTPEIGSLRRDGVDGSDDYSNGLENGGSMGLKKNKKIVIAILAVVVLVAAACGVYFGFFYEKEEPATEPLPVISTEAPTEAPVIITNPLTGETGYSEAAVGKRPISVVVENASGARPQYNMDTPDIIVEGEVEGGETRMLWFYADMNSLPDLVGPVRSARPSFVRFSELFDSVFVHYGASHSKDSYVGGYEVIESDDVDDVDGMTTNACFKRTSDKVSPHNAALLGDKLTAVIENKGYRTELDKDAFSAFAFNESVQTVSDTPCGTAVVRISSRTAKHTLVYDETTKTYVNKKDYGAEISFTNLIVLSAETKYISKSNYKGTGKTETYLNYDFSSGEGQLISCGTVVDFDWAVNDGKLSFTDKNGNELKLNPGRSWICLNSSNNGGSVTVTE